MNGTIPADGYVIIIGAMRSGTTTLYRYLKQHPAICEPLVKEPRFFSSLPDTDVTRYEELWSFIPSEHRYALEASVDYTKFPAERDVPQKIWDYGIRPKLIYIVRDPFKRIESHYAFMQQRNKGWNRAIDEGILVDQSDYFLQLQQFRKVFPKEDFLVLDFDNLSRDPIRLMETTLNFLGLPGDPGSKYTEVSNAARATSATEERLLRHRWAYRWIPRIARNLVKSVLRKLSSPSPKRKLTSDERKKIFGRLSDNMIRFQDEYGIDVAKWGF